MNNNTTLNPEEPASTASERATLPARRILVVDDDFFIRQLSAKALVRSGYKVDASEDGEAAWEALHANSYDLLITDNNMPKLSGVELIRKMRSASMALPVILVSGTIPAEELNLQLAATLPKPFSGDELLETVSNVLRAAECACEQIKPLPGRRNHPPAVALQM